MFLFLHLARMERKWDFIRLRRLELPTLWNVCLYLSSPCRCSVHRPDPCWYELPQRAPSSEPAHLSRFVVSRDAAQPMLRPNWSQGQEWELEAEQNPFSPGDGTRRNGSTMACKDASTNSRCCFVQCCGFTGNVIWGIL